MRAKQLLGGAKPRVKSKSKNLIRIAQEEVKQGLVDYEIVKPAKEQIEEVKDSKRGISLGKKSTTNTKKKPASKSTKKKQPKKGKKS